MADTEHFVRDDVRGFLDMLEQIGGKGVEEVGAVEGRNQMRAMGQIAEAPARPMAIRKDLTCPGPAGDIPLRFYDPRDSRDEITNPDALFNLPAGGGDDDDEDDQPR